MDNPLTEKQHISLDLFREKLQDVWGKDKFANDIDAIRFLKARNFDVDKAVRMFRENMKWREDNQFDERRKTYKPPEVLKKYNRSVIIGHDRDHCPVMFGNLTTFNLDELLKCVTIEEIYAFLFMDTFGGLEEDLARQSKITGKRVTQFIAISDFKNFPLKRLFSRNFATFIFYYSRIVEANYPELAKRMYLLNAPKTVSLVYNFVNRFVPENTLKKLYISPVGDPHLFEDLSRYIDPEEIPRALGGSKSFDLSPYFITKINVEPFMAEKRRITIENPDYLRIPAKSVVKQTIQAQNGSNISWKFLSSRDILLRITIESLATKESHVIDQLYLQASVLAESCINCTKDGDYVFEFQNKFHCFREDVCEIEYKLAVES